MMKAYDFPIKMDRDGRIEVPDDLKSYCQQIETCVSSCLWMKQQMNNQSGNRTLLSSFLPVMLKPTRSTISKASTLTT